MKNIFKTSKRSIATILTLCILLCIAGTGVYAVSVMPEETTTTEDTSTVNEETPQELVPMMASACDHTHIPGPVITETRTCSCGKTFVYQYQNCTVCGCLLRVIGKCCN